MARIAQATAAPPAMSSFIRSMPSAGLIEMPPVSKVMPLPTRPSTGPAARRADRGGTPSAAAARCCRARRRAAGPCRASRSASRRAPRRRRPPSLRDAPRRASANSRGVSVLPGSFAKPRARLLQSPRIRPRATASSAAVSVNVRFRRDHRQRGRGRTEALAGLVLVHAEAGEDEPFGDRLDGRPRRNRPAQQERHARRSAVRAPPAPPPPPLPAAARS